MQKLICLILLICSAEVFASSPFLIDEEFDNAPTAPAGWTFTSISSYTTASLCGRSTPSLKFDATGDRAVTPTWSNGDQISFMMRAASTPNATDNMKVEVYDGSVWTVVANVAPHTTSRVTTISIGASVIQARFTYTKGASNTSFDDFTVRASGSCSGTGLRLTFINVDACGTSCEGKDEFLTLTTGSTSINIYDIEFSYPDANNFSVTTCGTSFNSPCDNYLATNTAAVAALNTLAGCILFTSAPATIPPNSNIIIFNGNPQNTPTNFSPLCSSGLMYYVLFVNNTTDCNGRFGNYGTSADTYRDFFIRDRSTGCTDTNYYFRDNVGLSDGSGNPVDGASVSYGTGTPVYIQTNCDFAVLPINLISFYAVPENRFTLIAWTTSSEVNNNYFSVEKSSDGKNFKGIGRVNGAGNSSVQQNYSLKDTSLISGISYYRLRQTDYDGANTLSKTIAVNLSSIVQFECKVYPNPFSDKISLAVSSLVSGKIKFTLADETGKILSISNCLLNVDFSNYELNYSEMASGMYFLTVETENAAEHLKILKK